jgi:organic radical activating enzyme
MGAGDAEEPTGSAAAPTEHEDGSTDPTREAGLAERIAPSAPGARRYAVKAVWRTVQGEGVWAGRAAVFVRFAGCNLWTGEEADRTAGRAPCSLFCDTDFRKAGSVRLSAADLVALVRDAAGPVRFCVLTGGEPLLQADAALVRALRADGFEVACETNGTVALADAFTDPATGALDAPDWVVCSPKWPEADLAIETCDELKLVVPDYRPDAYAGLAARVRPHRIGGAERRALWLQPEDGPRLDEATRLAVGLALADPAWRVSVQTHKVLGVD